MKTENIIPLTSLPQDWQDSNKILLLNFVRDGSGAAFFSKRYMNEVWENHLEHLTCYELDVEAHRSWLESIRIYEFPVLLIFYRGEMIASFYGLFPRHKLEDTISSLIDSLFRKH